MTDIKQIIDKELKGRSPDYCQGFFSGYRITSENIEKVMNKYIGAYFDAVQDTLEKKEESCDINLDIEMKIFSKVHKTLVEVKKEILK